MNTLITYVENYPVPFIAGGLFCVIFLTLVRGMAMFYEVGSYYHDKRKKLHDNKMLDIESEEDK